MDQTRRDIIKYNPIGSGLSILRSFFESICHSRSIPSAPTPESLDSLSHMDLGLITLVLLSTLQSSPVARILPAWTGRGTLQSDLLHLLSLISQDLELDRFNPLPTAALLNAALAEIPNDVLIWDQVYKVATEATPPLIDNLIRLTNSMAI
ncbi:hypothetical protein J3F84DRAFT_358963 [Trichoderma pleuroticola]